jgi:hypothetical protein
MLYLYLQQSKLYLYVHQQSMLYTYITTARFAHHYTTESREGHGRYTADVTILYYKDPPLFLRMTHFNTACFPYRMTHFNFNTACFPYRMTHFNFNTACFPYRMTHFNFNTACFPYLMTHFNSLTQRAFPTVCHTLNLTKQVLPIRTSQQPALPHHYTMESGLLQKSEGTLCAAGSVSLVQPSWCFVLMHPSPAFYWVTSGQCYSQGFNVSLAKHHFIRNLLRQKCWGNRKKVLFFNLRKMFNALSHTPELHMQHTKPLQSRLESAVCVCAISVVKLSSLLYFGSSFDWQNLVKIKGVP